jgi:hypothetical protein
MTDETPLRALQDEIAGALKHAMPIDDALASVSKQTMPANWHEFDRALLVFLSQTEAKAAYFFAEFGDLEGDPVSPGPGAYHKALWGILRNAQTLRQLLLRSANYMTDEERARLLDTSSLDDLLKQDE